MSNPTPSDVHVDTIINNRQRALKKKRMKMDMALSKLAKGDYPGHPFRGNQWTGGVRGRNAGRGLSGMLDAQAAPKPKPKSMKQMREEVASLTPAQDKRYWATKGTHEDGMKAALGAKYKPPAAAVPKAPKKVKPPVDADGDTPPQATNKNGSPKFDKEGNPVWLKPSKVDPDIGPQKGDGGRFSEAGGDPVRAGMRRPTNYERKYGVVDDEGNRYRIPPNYHDVWVSSSPAGNSKGILVSGIADNGKPQPTYTKRARSTADKAKFSDIDRLSKEIGRIDKKVRADMIAGDERALALGVIRAAGLRSGSTKEGTGGKAGKSFGATTLLASHVTVTNAGVRLQFPGKRGKMFDVTIDSPPELVAGLRKLKQSKGGRGATLFDQSKASYDKTSDYLKSLDPKGSFTLHDLRTLKATEVAAAAVRSMPVPKTRAELERFRKQVGKEAAVVLNDSVSVALGSYVHPAVFAKWEKAISNV